MIAAKKVFVRFGGRKRHKFWGNYSPAPGG